MPTHVVVRILPGPSGQLLVCMGEHAVVLDAQVLQTALTLADDERERPNPPYTLRARDEALGDLADEDLREALERPGGITRGQERIFVDRLDG